MRISELQNYSVVQTASMKEEQAAANDSTAAFSYSPTDTPLEAGAKSAGNVPSSAANVAKSLFSAITHPVQTAKGLANSVIGGGGALRDAAASGIDAVTGSKLGTKALGAGQQSDASKDTFNALTASLKERYGSLEAAQKTATEDPIGFGADVVAILSGTGAPRLLTTTATKAGLPAAIEKTSSAFRTTVAGKLDDAAVKQMEKALFINPSDVRKISKPSVAGENPAEWLLRRDFQGSKEEVVKQLQDYGSGTKSAVDDGLSGITARVVRDDAQPAIDTLEVLKKTFEDTIGNDDIITKIDGYLEQPDFSLSDLNAIKRMADAELNIFKVTGDIKNGATSRGLFNVRDQLKTLIEDEAALNGFADVKKLNKETQVSYEIAEALQKRLNTEGRHVELGLRDAILGIGSFAATSDIVMSGMLVIGKKVIESAQFRTFLANKLKKAPPSQKEELIEAVRTRNHTKVLQFLAPLAHEFEQAEQSQQNTEPSPEQKSTNR